MYTFTYNPIITWQVFRQPHNWFFFYRLMRNTTLITFVISCPLQSNKVLTRKISLFGKKKKFHPLLGYRLMQSAFITVPRWWHLSTHQTLNTVENSYRHQFLGTSPSSKQPALVCKSATRSTVLLVRKILHTTPHFIIIVKVAKGTL